MHTRPATKAEALSLLEAFVPKMGKLYANGRNFDQGPGAHDHVSTLSPYIRRRLVTERDLVASALAEHGPEGTEKFIQEVIWRGYFKGWLERRPSVWTDYRTGLNRDLATLSEDRKLRNRVAEAEEARTGLDCFDAWAEELVTTGYLHNHARMWFASIWIFTFGLPWRLGADFFYRHLLDGDPASNTLSWRWVAGLHTPGKTYEAQAWNIAKFTNQRFSPRESDFNNDVQSLHLMEEPEGLPEISPLRDVHPPEPGIPTALLITEEDCSVDDFDLEGLDFCAAATLSASHLRSPRVVADYVSSFEAGALRDTAKRTGQDAKQLHAKAPDELAKWAEAAGAKQIATPYIPHGPLSDWLREAKPALQERGIRLREWRREWDALIWPHATAGFFKVKKQIPEILHKTGLG